MTTARERYEAGETLVELKVAGFTAADLLSQEIPLTPEQSRIG